MKKRLPPFPILLLSFTVIVIALLLFVKKDKINNLLAPTPSPVAKSADQLAKEYKEMNPEHFSQEASVAATASAEKSASASAELSFDEMNKQFGPCAVVPTLMYHHVEDTALAKAEGHAQLTDDTKFFRKHMQYLKDKNYTVISMQDLVDFFNTGKKLPPKPVLLTFDDGYIDFFTDAWPILKEFGFKAT